MQLLAVGRHHLCLATIGLCIAVSSTGPWCHQHVSEPKVTFRLSGLPFPAVLQAEKLRLQDLPKSPAPLSELGLIFGFPDSQAQTCPSGVRKKLAAV